MVDYLVVGLGLAGISFCETLEKNGKTFKVINDRSQTSSLVAGGIYNPIVLKRYNLAWKADEQLQPALNFYKLLENKLRVKLDHKIPILRRFASIEEQNLWFEAADNPKLAPFLSSKLVVNKNSNIDAPYGFGKVEQAGKVDTKKLLTSYQKYLLEKGVLIHSTFEHDRLEIDKKHVTYKTFQAKKIVFAEGFGLKQNPFFNYLPLNGSKGEYLMVKAPDLAERSMIKSNIFLIPEGEDVYRVGATYTWKDKTNLPTQTGRKELLEKLDAFLKCDYEIVDQIAGVRPTVSDRRPLIGCHPNHSNLYLLNGFGSRGVLIAPYASQQLFKCIEYGEPLHNEMDISRFSNKYQSTSR